jgi:hypothetical protein
MGTTLRFKVGLVLALLGLLTLTLNPPPLALAQDDEPAAEVETAQTTEEQAEEPPVVEDEEPVAEEPAVEEPVEEEPVQEEPVEEEPAPPADTTAPSINQPEDKYVKAEDASGRVVEFSRPDADDDVDGDVPVDCTPGSGSLFPLGTTVVTCSAWDSAGNANSVSFAVVVTDQTAPSIDGAV